MKKFALCAGVLALSVLVIAPSVSQALFRPRPTPYYRVVSQVAGMVGNAHAQRLVRAKNLRILNVMWEDTGRWQGSSVGPNISDVTIEVHARRGQRQVRRLMPVIRYPNFTDKTADLKMRHFFIRVGNQRKGGLLETIPLKKFLANPTRYMSFPTKGTIKGGSLLAPRDSHVLVSAQAAFLPIPRRGKAKFYPVIFNYQSSRGAPAVLTLLVTRQGTSMTIIDNSRDSVGRSWGQRLFFNKAGRRAPLVAERLSDVMAQGTTSNGGSAQDLGKDANLLMLIQIPLEVKRRRRYLMMPQATGGFGGFKKSVARRRGGSNVEAAVLGHGKTEGPYTELGGLTIARDPRFPVRVTVQFYQATSNGVISAADVRRLHKQITDVYEKGDYVGSLVVPENPQRKRPTDWTGSYYRPHHVSWRDFAGLRQWYNDRGYHWWRPGYYYYRPRPRPRF